MEQVWSTPGRMWNILSVSLYETGTYLGVSGRNIPQVKQGKSVLFSYLTCFELRTENPRVDGSHVIVYSVKADFVARRLHPASRHEACPGTCPEDSRRRRISDRNGVGWALSRY